MHAAADSKQPIVVGTGGCGIDLLATVAKYPEPDTKLRSEAFEKLGGGNAGNALVAAARLGLRARILSKIGDDQLATDILRELDDEGIDTRVMVQGTNESSAFTYILVDRAGVASCQV